MIDPEAFGERAREALAAIEGGGKRRVSQAKLAKAVSALLPADDSISQQTAGNWLRGAGVPGTLERALALAKVLRCDPGWLAFGPDSFAPGVATYRKLLAKQQAEKRQAEIPLVQGVPVEEEQREHRKRRPS